jgi:hypothetical protein
MSLAQEQLNQLNENIEELEYIIYLLTKSEKAFDYEQYLLTPRQIAKKIMSLGSPLMPKLEGVPVDEDNEKSIHMVVYGKYKVDENGTLIDNEKKDPDCVDPDKCLNLKHPIFDRIKVLYKELKNSLKQIPAKLSQLGDAYVLAGQQIITGTLALVSSAIVLPIGSGVPAALAAVQTIVSAITDLQYKTLEILPLLGPLLNIPLMIMDAGIAIILAAINLILTALILIIGSIVTLKQLITPLILAIGA